MNTNENQARLTEKEEENYTEIFVYEKVFVFYKTGSALEELKIPF